MCVCLPVHLTPSHSFFFFVSSGQSCQSSSRWWVTTSSEGFSIKTWQSIKPVLFFCLTNQILWNFNLTSQISHFSFLICRLHPHFLPLLRMETEFSTWSELDTPIWRRCIARGNMAATKWRSVGAFDAQWQKWTNVFGIIPSKILFSSTCTVISSLILKNAKVYMYLYIYTYIIYTHTYMFRMEQKHITKC